MQETIDIQQKRIDNAITRISLGHLFYTALLLRLRLEPTQKYPTMATDGTSLVWNPGFVATLDDDEIAGVLVHEVMHCVLGHPWRIKDSGFDPRKANFAADYVINNHIDDYSRQNNIGCPLKLPVGGLLDHQYDPFSMEEVYARLPDPPAPDKGEGKGEGSGEDGVPDYDCLDPGALGDAEGAAQSGEAHDRMGEQDWKDAAESAYAAAKVAGDTCGSAVSALMGRLRRPQEDWRRVLARYVDDLGEPDYDWMVRDRRFADFYLPGVSSEGLGEVYVGLDTSGSIYSHQGILDSMRDECEGILDRARPESLTVMHCDTRIRKVESFEPGDRLGLEPVGGGGTDFNPFFEEIEGRGSVPAVLIVLTDGYGRFPAQAPDYPVLWVSYGLGMGGYPFGEVLMVNSN